MVEFEYRRGGTLAYLAAWDVHHANLFDRVESKTGIEPFGRLVDEVMGTEPYKSARRVFWIVDNGSSHAGKTSIQRMQDTYPRLSGYFWDEHVDCLPYMREAVAENHGDWIERELQPLVGGELEALVLNNLTAAGEKDRFLNRTFAVGRDADYLTDENTYDKVFLPGIEKHYTESGRDDRLVLQTRHGRLEFTTCCDYLFSELLREYAMVEEVDAVVQVASWRAAGSRDYPAMNLRTDTITATCGIT